MYFDGEWFGCIYISIVQFILSGNKGFQFRYRKAAFVWLSHHQPYNISLMLLYCSRSRIVEDFCAILTKNHDKKNFQNKSFWRELFCWVSWMLFLIQSEFQFLFYAMRFIGWFPTMQFYLNHITKVFFYCLLPLNKYSFTMRCIRHSWSCRVI